MLLASYAGCKCSLGCPNKRHPQFPKFPAGFDSFLPTVFEFGAPLLCGAMACVWHFQSSKRRDLGSLLRVEIARELCYQQPSSVSQICAALCARGSHQLHLKPHSANSLNFPWRSLSLQRGVRFASYAECRYSMVCTNKRRNQYPVYCWF